MMKKQTHPSQERLIIHSAVFSWEPCVAVRDDALLGESHFMTLLFPPSSMQLLRINKQAGG